jgi:DNA polymerase-1
MRPVEGSGETVRGCGWTATTISAAGRRDDAVESFLHRHLDALEQLCVPAVTRQEAEQVRAILRDAGAIVTYVANPAQADIEVTALIEEYHAELAEHGRAVIGLDMETEVLAELRQPIPVKFNKDGRLAIRQPKDGVAGLALDPFSSKVRLVQMWISGLVRVFDMRVVPWSTFVPLFNDSAISWAAFAATFEAKRLIHETGAMPAGRLYDVRTALWMTHGQLPNLEDAAKLVFDITVPKVLGASDWSADTLSQEQLEYAALDAVLATALWHEQRSFFEQNNPEAEVTQYAADSAIEAVARTELIGVGFDRAAHADLVASWEIELTVTKAAQAVATPGVDWRKQKARQDYLTVALLANGEDALEDWPRTRTGLLATDQASLAQAAHIPGVTEHLEVLRLEKLLSAFGDGLVQKINPRTDRLHTSLSICGARTGRFSSRGPNLQQLPKRRSKAFRSVIVAAAGKVVMVADYSQIELRAAAEVIFATVGESKLHEGFAAGLDAHRTTAMYLAGKADPTEVTDDERNLAKAPNFGMMYGMSARGFFRYVRNQYQPDITTEEAYALYDAMHDAYPELGEWHYQQEHQCRRDGYVETPLGRRWYWEWRARGEDEIDDDAGFVEDQRSGFQRNFAFNMPVQGGCAEVILVAMTRLDRALRPYPARLCLSVHDEVLIELADAPDVIADVRTIVVEEMTSAFLHVFPDAPTIGLVDPTVGRSWGEQVSVDEWLNPSVTTRADVPPKP